MDNLWAACGNPHRFWESSAAPPHRRRETVETPAADLSPVPHARAAPGQARQGLSHTVHSPYFYNLLFKNSVIARSSEELQHMKIVCQQEDLPQRLAIAARGVSQRSTVQILSGILSGPRPAARSSWPPPTWSSRFARAVRPQVAGAGLGGAAGHGSCSTSSKRCPQRGHDRAAAGYRRGALACGSSEYTLHAQGAEDFPHLPEPDGAAVRVDRAAFVATINHVSRAASRDESRPVLTGVLVEFGEGAVTMAATDSYRLSVKQSPLPGSGLESQAIVPARALGELSRIARHAAETHRDLDRREPDPLRSQRRAALGSPHRRAVPQLPPAPAADVRARDPGVARRVSRRRPAHVLG